VHLFFAGTTSGGGTTGNPVVYDILAYENRQIYYMLHNIPTVYKQKSVHV